MATSIVRTGGDPPSSAANPSYVAPTQSYEEMVETAQKVYDFKSFEYLLAIFALAGAAVSVVGNFYGFQNVAYYGAGICGLAGLGTLARVIYVARRDAAKRREEEERLAEIEPLLIEMHVAKIEAQEVPKDDTVPTLIALAVLLTLIAVGPPVMAFKHKMAWHTVAAIWGGTCFAGTVGYWVLTREPLKDEGGWQKRNISHLQIDGKPLSEALKPDEYFLYQSRAEDRREHLFVTYNRENELYTIDFGEITQVNYDTLQNILQQGQQSGERQHLISDKS